MNRALKLHEKLKSQVKTERKITHEILLTLQEFDLTQCYRELGYSSMHNYLVQGHGYSEGAANRRIQASRLLRQCPSAAVKIEEGKLNLSQLALAQSAIKQEEKKSGTKISNARKQETLQALQGKNNFETQKLLVETFPQFEISKPKALPTKNKSVQVQLEFSEQDWEKIQSLLAHMSHKVPNQKLESALLYWANQIEKKKQNTSQRIFVGKKTNDSNVESNIGSNAASNARANTEYTEFNANTESNTTTEFNTDVDSNTKANLESSKKANFKLHACETSPTSHVAQATRVTTPAASIKTQTTQKASSNLPPKRRRKSRRRYISVKIKRQVFLKAENQCEYRSPLTGERCKSSHYLDIDHITPLALGGSDIQDNLRALCRSHNQLLAKQMHLFSIHS